VTGQRNTRWREYRLEPYMVMIVSIQRGVVLFAPGYLRATVGNLVIEWESGQTTLKHAVTGQVL